MVIEVREKDACWASGLCNWVNFSLFMEKEAQGEEPASKGIWESLT